MNDAIACQVEAMKATILLRAGVPVVVPVDCPEVPDDWPVVPVDWPLVPEDDAPLDPLDPLD
jgi:hypothetical protein